MQIKSIKLHLGRLSIFLAAAASIAQKSKWEVDTNPLPTPKWCIDVKDHSGNILSMSEATPMWSDGEWLWRVDSMNHQVGIRLAVVGEIVGYKL